MTDVENTVIKSVLKKSNETIYEEFVWSLKSKLDPTKLRDS